MKNHVNFRPAGRPASFRNSELITRSLCDGAVRPGRGLALLLALAAAVLALAVLQFGGDGGTVRAQSQGQRVIGIAPVAHIRDGTVYRELEGARDITTITIGEQHFALVASQEDNGVQVIDITDPFFPAPAAAFADGARYPTLQGASGITTITISGNHYALVAAKDDNGVQIIDITYPYFPSPVAHVTESPTFPELGGAYDITTVTISGNHYALVASYLDDGVQIINITNPASPTAAANVANDEGGFDELNEPRGITTVSFGGNHYALVASRSDDALQIINITDPTMPSAVATAVDGSGYGKLDGAYDVTTIGVGGNHYALVASLDEDAVQFIDITDPTMPSAAGGAAKDNRFPKLDGAIAVAAVTIEDRQYALVAGAASNGIQIIDFTTPATPLPVANVADGDEFPVLNNTSDIATITIGGRHYALITSAGSGGHGVQIVELLTGQVRKLVNNFDNHSGDSNKNINVWGVDNIFAQTFNLGYHPYDYTLSRVELYSRDPEGQEVRVRVCPTRRHPTASHIPIDSECTLFDPPESFSAGKLVFTAPNVMKLSRLRFYAVEITSPSAEPVLLGSTTEHDDDVHFSGWVTDTYKISEDGGATWTEHTPWATKKSDGSHTINRNRTSFRIGLFGGANPQPAVSLNTPLVTNIGYTGQDQEIVVDGSDRAQAFTTGDTFPGFNFTGVELFSVDPEGDNLALDICRANADGVPDTHTCRRLTSPGSFAHGKLSFAAPSDLMTLSPKTTYAVRFTSPGNEPVRMAGTTSNGDRGQVGSTIRDSHHIMTGGSWSEAATGISFRMQILGGRGVPGLSGERVLVSNIHFPNVGTNSAGSARRTNDEYHIAESFHTGSVQYSVTKVDLAFGYNTAPNGFRVGVGDFPTLTLRTGDSYGPVVATFNPPSTRGDAGNYRFTPSSPVILQASARYWVVASGGDARWLYTNETREDVISLSDWNIGSTKPLKMRIIGQRTAQQVVVNSEAIGRPVIEGIAEAGRTLSASVSGIEDADGLDNVSFSYQWLGDGVEIAGANASEYTVSAGDVGKTISVRVDFVDDQDNDESLTSAATAAVVEAQGLAPQSASVDGSELTVSFGEELDNGVSLSGTMFPVSVNGSPRAVFAVGISQSNVNLFLTSPVEAGDTVTVGYARATGNAVLRDIHGREAESFSELAVTNDTAAPSNTPALGRPTISGTAQVGERLTADTSGISDADGLTNATFAYQWLADDADVTGANASTYTLLETDEGKAIKVTVSFTDDLGNSESTTSAATDPVAAAPSSACPAPALNGGAVLVWTGQLGIAKWPGHEFYGFGHNVRGALDDRTFTLGSNEYAIDHITQRDGAIGPLLFSLESVLTADEKRTLTLHACEDSKQLHLSDASAPSRYHTYQWNSTGGLDWTAQTERTLHLTQDAAPPSLSTAAVTDATLTLTFSEPLDETATPAAAVFAVTVGTDSRTISAVEVTASDVTLTLASAVSAGDTVTVDYTAPTGDPATRLQDLTGNAATSFSGQTVTNNTS